MRKSSIFALALTIVLFLSLCAVCSFTLGEKAGIDYVMSADEFPLLPVEGKDNLYYDPVEGIVYFVGRMATTTYKGYGFMSPYYADNDKPYHYNPETQTLYTRED